MSLCASQIEDVTKREVGTFFGQPFFTVSNVNHSCRKVNRVCSVEPHTNSLLAELSRKIGGGK